MTRPEEAPALARERAATARARGGYALDLSESPPQPPDVLGELLDLAAMEPDLSEARSTRALGAPVTFGKQALVRALWQYTDQLLGQRRGYHVALARKLSELDERVRRLESR